jgi:hypothetical protein
VNRTACCLVLVVAAALAGGASNAASPHTPQFETPTIPFLDGAGMGFHTSAAVTPARRRLAAVSWWGRAYAVGGGETVRVFVSTAYPEADPLGQRWADFFASLPHGVELSRVTAYIAPIDEVEEICGSDNVLGCYGGQRLVTVGEPTGGVPAAAVATHEYGHHVAANRSNSPWLAIDWGTKRWASYVGVCSRVASGTAYPGNEGSAYDLNPGEAFAESYRVLVETGGTATGFGWNIVSPSFAPDSTALARVKQDVLEPWSSPKPQVIRVKFPRGSHVWRTRVATPLDGLLAARLAVGTGAADELTLLADDGRTVLASGAWDSSGGISTETQICGRRSLVVRVTRHAGPRSVLLRVSVP